MSAEDRVVELERVLENLLDCFEETPTGVEVEIQGEFGSTELGRVGYMLEKAFDQAREVWENNDVED